MSDLERQILQLWDFGWCDHDSVSVPLITNTEDVIGHYMRSEAFSTSFVGPKHDFTPELHGPFLKTALSDSDFELVSTEEFHSLIEAIRKPDEFSSAATDDQWQPVKQLAAEVAARNQWCFVLRPNENDFDRFHDWGSVLEVFREFVFANPGSETIERLVFGYD